MITSLASCDEVNVCKDSVAAFNEVNIPITCKEPDTTPFVAAIAPVMLFANTLFHFAEVVPKSIKPVGTKFVVKTPNADILSVATPSPK